MLGSRSLLALVGWCVSVATAVDVVYVTDLTIFSDLGPCAKSAISGVVDYQTVSNCPEDSSALHSCICSKNAGGNQRNVLSSISNSIVYSCGSTATDEQASASTVLTAYCDQDVFESFPAPSHTVSQYIVDLSAYNDLAPCAQSGLGGVVLGMTWDRCQQDASLLATCACQKNQNSEWATEQISSSIKYYCDSHTVDISSGQAVFAGYCGLAEGTTSFPTPTNPPGDMTYYITALSEYKQLASCAQSAVSYHVLRQTADLCPAGPEALASCACLRSEMTGTISSLITSDVRYNCGSTAADDISSALDVWDLYCSAAKGLVTPGGVTGSASVPTSRTGSNGAQETGKAGSDSNNSSGGMEGTMSNTAVIAGAVVGAVVGTAIIAVIAFLLYRRSKKAQAAALTSAVPDATKPELDSTAIVAPSAGSPSPSLTKVRMDGSSPVSAMSSPYSPRPMTELHGQEALSPLTPHEAHSQQVYEAPGQSRPQAPGAPGMGWQSGPVPHAYEMDASDSRSELPPHAR